MRHTYLVPAGLCLAVLIGCGPGGGGPSGSFEPPSKPGGTTISGTVPYPQVSQVGFKNLDSGKTIICESSIEEGRYDWALPPGKYEVVAFDEMGGEATVKEVTVASSSVVVDIPTDLKFAPPGKAEKKEAAKEAPKAAAKETPKATAKEAPEKASK